MMNYLTLLEQRIQTVSKCDTIYNRAKSMVTVPQVDVITNISIAFLRHHSIFINRVDGVWLEDKQSVGQIDSENSSVNKPRRSCGRLEIISSCSGNTQSQVNLHLLLLGEVKRFFPLSVARFGVFDCHSRWMFNCIDIECTTGQHSRSESTNTGQDFVRGFSVHFQRFF